jgi:hypothetical protein
MGVSMRGWGVDFKKRFEKGRIQESEDRRQETWPERTNANAVAAEV